MSTSQKNALTDKERQEWYQHFVEESEGLRQQDGGTLIGKFFVVREGEIHSHFDKFETAYAACIEQFPDGRFLIQELMPENYTHFVFVTA